MLFVVRLPETIIIGTGAAASCHCLLGRPFRTVAWRVSAAAVAALLLGSFFLPLLANPIHSHPYDTQG